MKTALVLLAVVCLAGTSVAAAEPPSPAPVATVQPSASAAPDGSAEAALAKLFSEHRPVKRTSCYDDRYQACLLYCPGVSEMSGCDAFASQECLCERYSWADCPVCY